MWNENEEGKSVSYWKCGPQCIWKSKKLPSSFILNCRRPWDHHACHRLSSTAALALRSTADKATWQLGMANAIWWGLVLHCAFETKTFFCKRQSFLWSHWSYVLLFTSFHPLPDLSTALKLSCCVSQRNSVVLHSSQNHLAHKTSEKLPCLLPMWVYSNKMPPHFYILLQFEGVKFDGISGKISQHHDAKAPNCCLYLLDTNWARFTETWKGRPPGPFEIVEEHRPRKPLSFQPYEISCIEGRTMCRIFPPSRLTIHVQLLSVNFSTGCFQK